MKVTIHTSDETYVTVKHMPDADAAALIEDFHDGPDEVFTVTLDPDAITHINGRHIVRIDLDPEETTNE